jgi:hypothetical protein
MATTYTNPSTPDLDYPLPLYTSNNEFNIATETVGVVYPSTPNNSLYNGMTSYTGYADCTVTCSYWSLCAYG